MATFGCGAEQLLPLRRTVEGAAATVAAPRPPALSLPPVSFMLRVCQRELLLSLRASEQSWSWSSGGSPEAAAQQDPASHPGSLSSLVFLMGKSCESSLRPAAKTRFEPRKVHTFGAAATRLYGQSSS